jgi:hypothetical protein
MKMKLFEYAILLHPKAGKDGQTTGKTTILTKPTTLLAKDEKQVGMLVARQIPEQYVDRLELIEVIVRPF